MNCQTSTDTRVFKLLPVLEGCSTTAAYFGQNICAEVRQLILAYWIVTYSVVRPKRGRSFFPPNLIVMGTSDDFLCQNKSPYMRSGWGLSKPQSGKTTRTLESDTTSPLAVSTRTA